MAPGWKIEGGNVNRSSQSVDDDNRLTKLESGKMTDGGGGR